MEQTTTQIRNYPSPTVVAPVLKYCLYARKSMEAEEKQALSIESQVKEMTALAQQDNLQIVDTKREAHSSKEVGQRPIFNQMIAEMREGKFNAILTWAPDRLSRNAGDLGSVVDLMDSGKLIEIRTHGQKFTNNPNEKFLLMILGSQAKLENDNRGINVKRGLRARCEMGWRPGPAPTGYLNEKHVDKKCQCRIDPKRAPVIKKMFEKVAYENYSGRKLFYWLNNEIGFVAKSGKPLTLSCVYLVLKNHFYYGTFEYPAGSNNWYQGKHIPIISQDLFNLVQEKMTSQFNRDENHEFAFTKLMKCGLCGSGITASEKTKKQLNGNVHNYVYYGCTKFNDKECQCGYIREDELIKQFEYLIDRISLDEIGIKQKIKIEVERHKKFEAGLLGKKSEAKVADIDIRNYAKYILRDGTNLEKRELLSCFKSTVVLKNKQIFLE